MTAPRRPPAALVHALVMAAALALAGAACSGGKSAAESDGAAGDGGAGRGADGGSGGRGGSAATTGSGGGGATGTGGGGGATGTAGAGGATGTAGAGGAGAVGQGGAAGTPAGAGGGGAGGRGGAGGTTGQGGATGAGGAGGTTPTGPFPLKLSADRRYLVDQNNVPFLIQGDAAWSLIVQLTEADAEVYLEDRRARGFNLVMVNLIEHMFGDRVPNNALNQPPFTTANDFATPNEAYFAHADAIIRRAAAKGIVVLLVPAYLGYAGGAEGWYQVMVANGATKLAGYGRYVGNRYRAFDNIVWLGGGDYTPPMLALTNAVQNGIKEMDTRHLHAAHWAPETSGTEVAVSWIDIDTTYTYFPTYLKSLADYRRSLTASPARGHFFIEGAYEGEMLTTPQSLRAQAYWALLTGAKGQIFGNNPIWRFGLNWRSVLGNPGSVSMRHVGALFGPRAWTALVPDDTNLTLTAGQGTSGSSTYAVLSRSGDGRLAIAYVPTVRDVTINMARLAGPVTARWYDPSNGTFTTVAGSPLPNTGSRVFRPAGPNAGGAGDWVLVLEVM